MRAAFAAAALAFMSTSALAQNYRLNDATTEQGAPAKLTIDVTGARTDKSYVTLYVGLPGDSAKLGVDVAPIAKSFEVLPTDTRLTLDVATLKNDSVPGPAVTASTRLVVNQGGKLLRGSGVLRISDSDVAAPPPPVQPPPCPVGTEFMAGHCMPVPPVVTPPPIVTPPAEQPSNPLTGEKPIASNFDINPYLLTAPVPDSGKPDVVGAFRFICQAGQLRYDDPIVYPGQPGKSHLHQFYGNTSADANSTYASLRAFGVSSCEGLDHPALNRSAYWMPAWLDGKGNAIRPDFVSIYYKRRPITDPHCNGKPGTPLGGGEVVEGQCIQLPNGLKFIFGFDMITQKPATGLLAYRCQGPGAIAGDSKTITEALAKCPPGAQMGAVLEAPDCWNGYALDSANHRDHVAYMTRDPNSGRVSCPSTHPFVIATFTLGAWITVPADPSKLHLASDEMFPLLAAGSTYHADIFMAWDPTVITLWHGNCINRLLNCSAGTIGNGQRVQGMEIRLDTSPKIVPLSSIPRR